MSGGKTSNHCSGDSSFTFSAHMTGHASVDARNAGTGDNHCNQDGHSTGGSGSAKVTVPAGLLMNLGTLNYDPSVGGDARATVGQVHVGNTGTAYFHPTTSGNGQVRMGDIQSSGATTFGLILL